MEVILARKIMGLAAHIVLIRWISCRCSLTLNGWQTFRLYLLVTIIRSVAGVKSFFSAAIFG